MHAESMALMEKHLQRALVQSRVQHHKVLDVGSMDINGSYKELCEGYGMHYWGIDIRDGKNVDQMVDGENWHIDNESYDVVISGNSFHNMRRPWLVIKEMDRVLKPRGLLIIVTIWSHGINEYPADYWRITDNGLFVLFDETSLMTSTYVIEMDGLGNTAGSAFKHA